MSYKIYGAVALTGGVAGALDYIDGNLLNDGDMAIAFVKGDNAYHYVLDATLDAASSPPNVIVPVTNPGSKCWVLTNVKLITADFSGLLSMVPWGMSAVSTQLDINSNTTLQNITGLVQTGLIAGKTYQIEAVLFVTNTDNNGVKVAFASPDTLTATTFIVAANSVGPSGALVKYGRGTSLTGLLCDATAQVNRIEIKGTIKVNAAGTLRLQGAQNASHVDTLSFLPGSYMKVTQVAA